MSKKQSHRDFMEWFQETTPPFPSREWCWGRGALKLPAGGRRGVVELWVLKPDWGWCREDPRHLCQSDCL